MHFGVYGKAAIAKVAARAGYDFAEMSVAELLKPLEPEQTFLTSLAALHDAGLPCPAVNGFVPANLKITGPDVDIPALQAYVATVMGRAERAGVQIVVFGSGGARRIPDGFDRQAAHAQLAAFCRMAAPLARDHGVTIVVEPLNRAECNVLTTLAECAALVEAAEHPAIRLMVDAYHLLRDGDALADIVTCGKLLAHAHIATVPGRLAPGAEPCDFSRFFRALADAHYSGRISIEGKLADPAAELPAALALMRRLATAQPA